MNSLKIILVALILSINHFIFSEDDPLKNLNEKTHYLNDALDLQFASPVAKVYKSITPDPLEKGITNFIRNSEDLNIAINNFLQGKFKDLSLIHI